MSIVQVSEIKNTVEVTGENQIIVVQTSGVQGGDGQGVPSGGLTGYLLAKNSGTDFDTEWIDPTTVGVTDHGNLTGLADDDHTQYLNSARFDTAFASKSTTNLSEGTNLYYTAARFNSAFSGKTTTDLTEGTNLYYTTARFDSAFSGKNTDALSEGSTNLYYTATRFNTAFAAKSTTDLSEGTNLYYTSARFDSAFSGKTTDNLTEGSTNLYFTNARAISAVASTYVAKAGDTMTGTLVVPTLKAQSSAGLQLQNSGGTTLLDLGAGGGVNATISAPLNITGRVIQTGNADTVQLTVKGNATQTANLEEWQTSAGAALSYIKPDGSLTLGSTTSTASLHVQTFATNRNGISIQATSGQTSNLLAILDATANPVAGINHSGQMQATANATGYIFSGNDAIGMSGVGAVLTLRSNYTERLRVHTDGQIGINTLATPTAQLDVRSGGASRIVQIIRGVSGQSASLTEWQDNTGTALVRIDSSGRVIINNSAPSQNSGLHVRTFGATSPSMIVQNVSAQTADMLQFRDSGGTTVFAAVSTTAQFQGTAGSASTPSYSFYGFSNNGLFKPAGDTLGFSTASSERMRITSSGQVSIGVTSGIAQLGVVNSSAGGVATVIRGAASQSANLVQWQDAVGTVLSAVTSAGYFQAGGASGVGTLKLQSDRAAILIKGSTDAPTGPYIDYDINSSTTANVTFARLTSGTLSGALTGTSVAVSVSPTYNPAAGSANFRTFDINYTNNASGAQTGISTGLRVNRNTSGTAFPAIGDLIADFQSAGAQRLTIYAQGTTFTEINTATNGAYGIRTDGAAKVNSFYNYATSGGWYTSAGNPIMFSNTSDLVGVGISSGIGAKFHIGGFTAGTIGQIIRGAASQTANLTEWQNSSGSTLARVDLDGKLIAAGVGAGSSGFYSNLSGSRIFSSVNGNWTLSNLASTDFGLLQFGGTTSSFPSLKRSSATLQARLADDSVFADISANVVISNSTVRLKGYTVAGLPAGTVGDTAYCTDLLAPTFGAAAVGGGAVVLPVFYDGTTWIVG